MRPPIPSPLVYAAFLAVLALALTGSVANAAAEFRRGDANGDGGVDISDAIFSLNFSFGGGPEPSCKDAADANDDGGVDISDPISLLNYQFSGGPAPAAPGPTNCGPDPTDDGLGCDAYEHCDSDEPCDGSPGCDYHECFTRDPELDVDGDRLRDDCELPCFGTSPSDPDTDGDGVDDGRELNGFDSCQNPHDANPRIADLPLIGFELRSRPVILITGTTSTGEERSFGTEENSTHSESYSRSTSSSISSSLSVSHETGVTTSAETEYGAVPPSPSVKVGVAVEHKLSVSFGLETSFSYGKESKKECSTGLTDSRRFATTEGQTLTGGIMKVFARIYNRGDLAFKLKRISLNALRRDDAQPSGFSSLATLNIEGDVLPQTLGVFGADSLPAIFSTHDLTVEQAQDLLENPDGLVLQLAGYELEDANNVAWAHYTTDIERKTATVIIDFGDGREPHTLRVATNVRDANGDLEGVRAGELFRDILHIPYETHEVTFTNKDNPDDTKTCRRIVEITDIRKGEEVRNTETRHWLGYVKSQSIGSGDDRLFYDFEDIKLRKEDVLHLSYIRDDDGDGLALREERLYGSRDDNPDTDGDGLGDFEEVREGWKVKVMLIFDREPREGYRVHPDPTLADFDNDGLSDPEEAELDPPTDPRKSDTDEDGLADGVEARESWLVEVEGRAPYSVWSDPTIADVDLDGLADSEEREHGTDPHLPDTDGDGLTDFEEVQAGEDGFLTSPLSSDTDGDGLDDRLDSCPTSDDCNENGIGDGVDAAHGVLWFTADSLYMDRTDPPACRETHTEMGIARWNNRFREDFAATRMIGKDTSIYVPVGDEPDYVLSETCHNDALQATAAATPLAESDYTVIAVARVHRYVGGSLAPGEFLSGTNSAGETTLQMGWEGSTVNRRHFFVQHGNEIRRSRDLTDFNAAEKQVFSVTFSRSDGLKVHRRGDGGFDIPREPYLEAGDFTMPVEDVVDAFIGSRFSGGIDITEILCWNVALTDDQRENAFCKLRARYGIADEDDEWDCPKSSN